jgi:hypothetical protein
LLAQPAAFTCSVSRIVFVSAMVGILKHEGFALKSRAQAREPYGRDDLEARD